MFNAKRPVNFERLNELETFDEITSADDTPSYAEFEEAMKKLSTDKAGGENGVIPEMVKALMGENRMKLYDYLIQF